MKYRLQRVCDIYTVYDKNWNALENGDLLAAMDADGFDYLLTSDKNFQHQQNIEKDSLGFIVLKVVNNNYETILPLVEKIRQVLIRQEIDKLIIIGG